MEIEKHFQEGLRNCRSLGFARDDKKEGVVVKIGRLLKDRAVAKRGGSC
jgi:hypothetical protein